MAEKSTFENELPKKSTVKWLRGLDENGNPVLIDISDHATVVGGLLPVVTESKEGLSPTGSYLRKYLNNEWYSLCVIDNSSNVINLQSVPYINSIGLNADIIILSYGTGKQIFKFNMTGNISATYDTKLKYKFDGNKCKIWINTRYVAMQILHMNYISNILLKEEPDSDAIEVTGNL